MKPAKVCCPIGGRGVSEGWSNIQTSLVDAKSLLSCIFSARIEQGGEDWLVGIAQSLNKPNVLSS